MKKKCDIEAANNYARRNYDRFLLMMPSGAKAQIAEKAAAAGISTSRYILQAVEKESGLKLTLDNSLPWISGKK